MIRFGQGLTALTRNRMKTIEYLDVTFIPSLAVRLWRESRIRL
jgi:hypothetical protein